MKALTARLLTKKPSDHRKKRTLSTIYKRVSRVASLGAFQTTLSFNELKWDQLSKSEKREICDELHEKGYKGRVSSFIFFPGCGSLSISWEDACDA